MTVRVGPPPDNIKITHHVKLSKGGTDVGLILCDMSGEDDEFQIFPEPNPRTPLRTASGETEYGDINPHLTGFAQKNFSVGRGYRDFDDQRSGYADAHRVDTTRENEAIPAGQYFYAEGVRNWLGNWERHNAGGSLIYGFAYYTSPLGSKYYAMKFTTGAAGFDAAYLEVVCQATVSGNITVTLRSDNVGDPGTIRRTVTISAADVEDTSIPQHVRKPISSYTLGATTSYWIVVDLSAVEDDGLVLIDQRGGAGGKTSTDGSVWNVSTLNLFCRVTDADKPFKALFQDYKGCLYTALSYFDNSAPKVFDNGYHGVSLGTSTSTQINVTGAPFVADEHIGAICYIWGGVGADQYRPWRKIVDNTTSALIFTGDPWDITPDATTVIGIMASEKFNEITGHGLTTLPYDFLSTHQCMYLAMGQGVNVKRLVCYNNAGTWTQTYADDGTNKADLLFPVTNGGVTELWKANRAASEVAAAPAQDGAGGSPSDLVFAAAFDVGSTDTKINSLGSYGESPHLWVFKEDIPYEVIKIEEWASGTLTKSDKPFEFLSSQMKAMRDWRNGKANIQFDRNLYWGFRESCERWSDSGDLLHMGPDVRGPEGMPSDRRGYFADFAEIGGWLIGAYDGGDSNYSSILVWNGEGWHELFRAPWKGARILSLKTQAIEGDAVDRLWFGCGSDVMCIPISENPKSQADVTYNFYPYIWSCEFESGWVYYNLREVEKYFDKVKGILENTEAGSYSIMTICYKVDNDSAWTEVGSLSTTPSDSLEFSANNDLTAQKIKLRVLWVNYRNKNVGHFLGWVIDLGLSLDQKYIYRLRFRVKDRDIDLLGVADDYTSGSAKLSQIKTWANEKSPVLMNMYDPSMDNKYGFIDYPSIRVIEKILDKGQITRVCEMVVKEI